MITLGALGAVLIGYVRSGTARVGQVTVRLALGDAAPRRLEVIGVERLSSIEPGGAAVGLVFRNPPRRDELLRMLPVGSMLALEDPGQPAAGAG